MFTGWVVFLSYSKDSQNYVDDKGGSLQICQLVVPRWISPKTFGKPDLSWEDLSVFNNPLAGLSKAFSFAGFSAKEFLWV